MRSYCVQKDLNKVGYDYIQGVSKNPWTNFKSKFYASRQRKKFIYARKGVVFEFNWKITFNNKHLKYVMFYLQLT